MQTLERWDFASNFLKSILKEMTDLPVVFSSYLIIQNLLFSITGVLWCALHSRPPWMWMWSWKMMWSRGWKDCFPLLGLFGKDHRGRSSQNNKNRKCLLGDLELLSMLQLQSPAHKDKRDQLPEVNCRTGNIWHVRSPSLFASMPSDQRMVMFRNEHCIWDRLKKPIST